MYGDLEILLRQRRKNIVYVPNNGNAGDAFIAHAAYQFLGRLGVRYEIGSLSGNYPGHVIICAGGGNLVAPYRDMIDFISRNQGAWRELIVLPHTIRDYGDTLSELRQNCFVFCREKPSYDFVRRHALNANVFLSHDLAFGCDFNETKRQMRNRRLRDWAAFVRHLRSNMRHERYLRGEMARAANLRTQPDVLNAFRTDVEKTALELPADNIDISRLLEGPALLPVESLHTTYRMMRYIGQFRVIMTNRLHIGIMSAMLGLEVHFFDNSYGKNHDVFSHSMQGRFPNVHWHPSSLDVHAPPDTVG